MNKAELKALLKPLIKECIRESLLEGGILSGIISEVVTGLNTNTIMESKEPKKKSPQPKEAKEKSINERLLEQRKKLMGAIGADAYGGADLFEGTTPAPGQRSPEGQASNPLGDMDPNDAGIDISGFMAAGGNKWKSLIG
jgi:hypothetical protein